MPSGSAARWGPSARSWRRAAPDAARRISVLAGPFADAAAADAALDAALAAGVTDARIVVQ